MYLESSHFLFFLFFPSSSSSSQKSRYLWLHIDRKCKQLLELENVTHFLRCGGSKEIAILLSSSSSIQSWKKTTTTSWGYAEAAFPCVSQKTCPIWKTICMSYYFYLPIVFCGIHFEKILAGLMIIMLPSSTCLE